MTTFAIVFGTFVLGLFLGFLVAGILAAGKRADEAEMESDWDV